MSHDRPGQDPLRPEDMPGLAEDRDTPAGLDPAEAFARLAADTVDAPPRWDRRLMELSTARRMAVSGLGALALLAISVGVAGPRGDLEGEQWRPVLALAAGLGGLAVVAWRLGLRGVHERPMGKLGPAMVALVLAAPLALTLLPGLMPVGGSLPPDLHPHCALESFAVAAFAGAFGILLQRRRPPDPIRGLIAAGSGGLLGYAVLALQCPYRATEHLLMTHQMPAALAAVVFGVGLLVWQRRS